MASRSHFQSFVIDLRLALVNDESLRSLLLHSAIFRPKQLRTAEENALFHAELRNFKAEKKPHLDRLRQMFMDAAHRNPRT